MKKLYTFIGAALMVASVNAQAYLGKDFEDQDISSGGFTNYDVIGSESWFAGSFNGDNFAKNSNYSGGVNSACEAWYITPAVDLSGATSPIFSFSSACSFTGDDIEIYTSNDYDGSSDPTSQGTWTTISAPLSTGNYDWVSSGEIAVTAPSATTYFAFKYTGSASDGKTWELDSIFVAEAGTAFESTIVIVPPTTVSVYDIQYSTATPADSPLAGTTVSTGGMVTHVRSDNKGFYISSGTGPWSGIYVYSTLTPSPVAVGDSVTFDADVVEYNELTELSFPNNLTVVSSGNFFFATDVETGSALSEEYEGCFVSACGQCTVADNSFGDWILNDGSGDAEIGDFFFSNTATAGTTYNTKGIIDFAFGYFGWLPRNASDVQAGACPVSVEETEVTFGLYPNPTSNELNIDIEGNHNVTIIDLNGKVVSNTIANGFTTMNVSNLTSGIYFVRVGTSTSKFIKK